MEMMAEGPGGRVEEGKGGDGGRNQNENERGEMQDGKLKKR